MRALVLAGVLVPGVVMAQASVFAPLERVLARISFGPTVGGAVSAAPTGVGGLVTVGAGFSLFEEDVVTDEACERRREEERAQLGGDVIAPWGDVIRHAQQPCRPIARHWYVDDDAGIEFGFAFGGDRFTQLRLYSSPVSWRYFSFGVSTSGVLGQDAEADPVLGVRVGPELAGHFRFGEDWRPVLTVFLRAEATLLRRDRFGDQVLFGTRFLIDL